MSLIVVLISSVILGWFAYGWYKSAEHKRKLNWLPNIPGWPLVGNALEFDKTTNSLKIFTRLFKKHGKLLVFSFLFDNLIFSVDYNFNEFILGTHKVLNKSFGYSLLFKWLGTGLLTADATKWRGRRKLITPAFHFSILEPFIDSFESNGKILIEKLRILSRKDAIDIYDLVTLYTLDVICETAMGVSVNAQRNEKSDYVRSVKEMSRISSERFISPVKRSDILFYFTKDYQQQQQALKLLHSFTYSVIDSRIEKQKAGGKTMNMNQLDDVGTRKKMAFLDILLQATENGQELSRDSIREEVDTFMFEGHDTTSSAISFVLYLLAQHPDVQDRALEEQRSIFGENRDRNSTYKDLKDMKYLECVIKETLRLYPSVPSYARQTNEDIYYKDHLIPKGTNITIFAYGIMRDPEFFPDPLKFNPSRFEDLRGKYPYSYIPFSAGPRNCIGQKFALAEMKSVLSKVLRNFQLLPAPEHQIILVMELILKSKNGVKIKLTERRW